MPVLPWACAARAMGALRAAVSLLAALVLCCVEAGCHQPVQPLRIGFDEWPVYQFMRLAEEKGFFREEGVDVKLLEFGSLADTRRAYESRRIDGMATTVIETLITRDQAGRNTRIVRVLNFSKGADVIVAGKSVRSMRDLRGKRVGVELGALAMYMLARSLELEGMSLEEVTLVSTNQAAMVGEMTEGRLDAAVAYPPASTSLLADPRFHAVFSSAKIPGEVADVIAIGGFVLRERPQQVAGFLRGLDRAFAYYKENPEDASRIMAAAINVSPEEFRESLTTGLQLVWPEEQAQYLAEGGKLQPVVDSLVRVLEKAGVLTDRPGLTDCLSPQ